MIKLLTKGYEEMCAGYSYSGFALHDGKTVKEVLEEIKEFSKNKPAQYLGDGFGNPDHDCCDAWGIKINGIPYVGCWAGWENKYKHQFDNMIVKKVKVDGGWYCWYDFNIEC